MFIAPLMDRIRSGDAPATCAGLGAETKPAGVAANGSGADAVVDVEALSTGDLKDRLVHVVAERARVEAEYLAILGELTSRNGPQGAAHVLREETRMNSPQARSEARLAGSLIEHGMTETLDALRSGEIQLSHARVIAREAPKKHRRSEAEFLELCRAYPSDTVARHPLAYQSQQVYADLAAEAAAEGRTLDPVDAEYALQHSERYASLRRGDDGMWYLRAKLDMLSGRQLSNALQAEVRSLRRRFDADRDDSHGADEYEGPTRGQLTADALCKLVLGDAPARRSATGLVIVADYDIVNDRLANPRLDDGTPLSAQMLAEYAIDARVLPAMFDADWSELALGRTRNANDAQRLVLAIRDGGCIGCELTAEHTQAHHIDFYEHGGLTEIPNLASMCWDCHKDLHQHDRTIHAPPDGRPRLQPPNPDHTDAPDPARATARSP